MWLTQINVPWDTFCEKAAKNLDTTVNDIRLTYKIIGEMRAPTTLNSGEDSQLAMVKVVGKFLQATSRAMDIAVTDLNAKKVCLQLEITWCNLRLTSV